jgi:hypothetical protein
MATHWMTIGLPPRGEVHQRIDAQTAGHLTAWVDRIGFGSDGEEG